MHRLCTYLHLHAVTSSPCCSHGVIQGIDSQVQIPTSGVPGLQDVQPHLQALDRKLYAVENVAGRHMAVDEMADMLGVAVPMVGRVGTCMLGLYIVRPTCWRACLV